MSFAAERLLDKGVSLKRAGDLQGSRNCYIEALQEDPFNMMAYISLGKTAHLLKEQDLAVRSYLAAVHLQHASVEKSILNNNLPMHLKIQYESIPKDALISLPSQSAFLIFIDSNSPRHVAHSLIDLNPKILNENQHLKPFADIYNAHIIGNNTHVQLIDSYRLSVQDQMQTDEKVYVPYGQDFLLQDIQWDKITSNDVMNIYF